MKISTQTQTWIPAKAFFTQLRSAKLEISPARMEMITTEGNTSPRVATMPPATPPYFWPMNVAVLTAMMPGVHWPTA